MSDYDLKPWPLAEYPSRLVEYRQAGDKFRGVIGCSRIDGALRKTVYFDFWCDESRDRPEDALSDARDLFHRLETHPPTVVLNGLIYSLPMDKEQTRAEKWLKENAHEPEEFEREFPGARLLNSAPFGSSTITGL